MRKGGEQSEFGVLGETGEAVGNQGAGEIEWPSEAVEHEGWRLAGLCRQYLPWRVEVSMHFDPIQSRFQSHQVLGSPKEAEQSNANIRQTDITSTRMTYKKKTLKSTK